MNLYNRSRIKKRIAHQHKKLTPGKQGKNNFQFPNHECAHTLGKYRSKQADQERHQKVLYYRQVKKLSIRETADATGYSTSQICRIQVLYKDVETD